MNAKPKQILKSDSLTLKQKIENSRNKKKKKQWKDLERHENVRGKMKVPVEVKTK